MKMMDCRFSWQPAFDLKCCFFNTKSIDNDTVHDVNTIYSLATWTSVKMIDPDSCDFFVYEVYYSVLVYHCFEVGKSSFRLYLVELRLVNYLSAFYTVHKSDLMVPIIFVTSWMLINTKIAPIITSPGHHDNWWKYHFINCIWLKS